MRIGIDARPLALESYTGIPKAVYEITKYWLENHPEHEYYMLSSIPVHFEENLPENWHVLDKPEMIDNQKFWALFELPKLIRELKLDVFWGSNYLLPRRIPGVRYCVTVYDLAIFRIPDIGESYSTFRLRVFGKKSCRTADTVVAISRATAEDVHEIFGIPRKKIAVSYCGGPSGDSCADGERNRSGAGAMFEGKAGETLNAGVSAADPAAAKTDEIREELSALHSGGFFLFISTIEPRKNIVTIVHAFEEYKRREQERGSIWTGTGVEASGLESEIPGRSIQAGSEKERDCPVQDMKLVLAGNRGWKYDEILAAVESSPYRKDILMPGYVSDAEKAMLLKNAAAFLYPSLYEGFGIPILEAMNSGCPVVTSGVSSMPEVGGDAAFYIREPKNSKELADRMEEVCSLGCEELTELRSRMQRQVRKFSWKKNAEQMLQILCRREEGSGTDKNRRKMERVLSHRDEGARK